MRISTKGRYGLRLMIELGINHQKKILPLKEIAVRQNISEKYLEQIINQLTKSGLVKSTRGSQGGYSLCTSPDQINVYQILQVLENSMTPSTCPVLTGNNCSRMNCCATYELWNELNENLKEILENKTLGQLVERQLDLDRK